MFLLHISSLCCMCFRVFLLGGLLVMLEYSGGFLIVSSGFHLPHDFHCLGYFF